MKDTKERFKLIDRLAVSFLSAILAFITGLIIWLSVISISIVYRITIDGGSFVLVLYFTAVMAIIGFFMMENIMVNIFGKIWNFVYKLMRGY